MLTFLNVTLSVDLDMVTNDYIYQLTEIDVENIRV